VLPRRLGRGCREIAKHTGLTVCYSPRRMALLIEDDAPRAAFRAELRCWLREAVGDAWVDAIAVGDEAAFRAARDEADKNGWNVFGWMNTIGGSGYGAPLWPKEYGGLSGEPWMQMIIREELGRHRLPTFGVNIL